MLRLTGWIPLSTIAAITLPWSIVLHDLFGNDPIPRPFISICSGCISSHFPLLSHLFLCAATPSIASFASLSLLTRFSFTSKSFKSAGVLLGSHYFRFSTPRTASEHPCLLCPSSVLTSLPRALNNISQLHHRHCFFACLLYKTASKRLPTLLQSLKSSRLGQSVDSWGPSLLPFPSAAFVHPFVVFHPSLSLWLTGFLEHAVASQRKPAQRPTINNWRGPTWSSTLGLNGLFWEGSMLAREGLSGPADERYEASVVGLLWTSQLWIYLAGKCHRRGGVRCGKKEYDVDETRRDETRRGGGQ